MSSTNRRGERDYISSRKGVWYLRFQYPPALRESACLYYERDEWPKEEERSLKTRDRAEAEAIAQPYIARHKRGLASGGVNGAVDCLERRGHDLAILVGYEGEALAEQMNDAGLDDRLREHRGDRLREALQAVDDGEQDIVDAAVFELVHDAQPKLRALVLLEPEAEHLLAAVGADPPSAM